jgi:hypothetical protein
MFAKRLEEYKINFLETRIVSQLVIFPISLVSLLSLYNLLKAGYQVPQYVESYRELFSISVIFHILVAFLFGARFILLFFNSKKNFWLSQLIWILCLMTLFSWCAYTKSSFYGFFYESSQISHSGKLTFSEAPITNFSLVSYSLDKLGSTYFFLSPIRQFFTFIISVFKRW